MAFFYFLSKIPFTVHTLDELFVGHFWCPMNSKQPVSGCKGVLPRDRDSILRMKLDYENDDTGLLPQEAFVPPALEELNKLIPDYEFLEFIDRGGMGAVYKAKQKSLNRVVAIKLLPLAHRSKQEFAERFSREAHALALLNHPHIVAVYDSGETPGGHMYYAMEHVKGTDLHHLMKRGLLTSKQILAIVIQVCEALQFAHEHGVLHRDIKPANILLDERGTVKVADFGLAKIRGVQSEVSNLTSPSVTMGTPDYIAPEALTKTNEVDHRADIYSVGVMLYEMLTGRVPRGVWEAPSTRIGADARLDEVVSRAMQWDPEKRYQNVGDITSVIQQLIERGSDAIAGAKELAKRIEEEQGSMKVPSSAEAAPSTIKVRKTRRGPVVLAGGISIILAMTFALKERPALVNPPVPPVTPKPQSVPMESQQKLARWVFGQGGFVNVVVPGQAGRLMGGAADVRTEAELPKGKFSIWRVSMSDSPLNDDSEVDKLIQLCAAADSVSNLNLIHSEMTPKALEHLPKLASTLTSLNIAQTSALSAQSLPIIAACRNLKLVYLSGSGPNPTSASVLADEELLRRLKELLPDCEIHMD